MTYMFQVGIEPDADQWRAYCPALESHAASTRGETREEALTHIHSICFMIVQQIVAQGAPFLQMWNYPMERQSQ